MTEFNDTYNNMIDMAKTEIQCINLYEFSKQKKTRRLMIFILEPFINLINNTNFFIFYNTLVNIENININNNNINNNNINENNINENNIEHIDYNTISLLVQESTNIDIDLLIGLLIESCKQIV